MTGRAPWVRSLVPPQGLDVTVPNVARIYDWLLGGKDNFAADREAGRRLLAAVPEAAKAARANRAFLTRAVRFLAEEAGIRQFLDIGTGLPTQGNVHEIAQATDPLTRVLYCDNDPVVVIHANALLANNLTVAATQADLRDPDFLFTLPLAHPLLDTSQPMAVLLVAVLHFLPDKDDPWGLVERIKRKLAPGSYVVISHATGDGIPAESVRAVAEVYEGASAPGVARSRDEIARFFDGLDLIEPGLVEVSAWRPPPLDRRPRPTLFYAGMGRKPLPAGSRVLAARMSHERTEVSMSASTHERRARSWTVMLDGKRLRELRCERGLSRSELAGLAGISKATVARLERRPRTSCRGRTLARLAAALGEKPASSGLLLSDIAQ